MKRPLNMTGGVWRGACAASCGADAGAQVQGAQEGGEGTPGGTALPGGAGITVALGLGTQGFGAVEVTVQMKMQFGVHGDSPFRRSALALCSWHCPAGTSWLPLWCAGPPRPGIGALAQGRVRRMAEDGQASLNVSRSASAAPPVWSSCQKDGIVLVERSG